jgi:hypothetical protein
MRTSNHLSTSGQKKAVAPSRLTRLYEPAGSGSGIGGAGTGGCPGVGSIGGSIGGPGVGGDGWSGVMGFGMSDTDAPLLNGGRNGRRPPIMLTVAGATRSVPRPLG